MNKIKFILLLIFCCIAFNPVFADALIAEISKDEYKTNLPQVLDAETKLPLRDATISLPSEGKFTKSDSNGNFKLNINKNSPIILSLQKDGYRPFSLTIKDGQIMQNLKIEMQKITPFNIVVSDNLMHLGDNSYSDKSSSACLINSPCVGPEFSKTFYVGNITSKTKAYVSIGSIIGLDTVQAMRLGQNKLTNATSTPLEIFVNNKKIGELKINGDNQKIPIPTQYLKPSSNNTLTLKTGVNKNTFDMIDYDDVEIMNLIVDIK